MGFTPYNSDGGHQSGNRGSGGNKSALSSGILLITLGIIIFLGGGIYLAFIKDRSQSGVIPAVIVLSGFALSWYGRKKHQQH